MPDLIPAPAEAPVPLWPVGDRPAVVLPAGVWQALMRGTRGRCPRCGQTHLFRAFLKPIDRCNRCLQDWSLQQADDFPAYVSLLITGHVIAPLLVTLAQNSDWAVAAILAVVVPLALLLCLGLLQPAKGAIIAVQWWLGMHGFAGDRSDTGPGKPD